MMPDFRDRALTRVEALRPRVKTLSHYVQMLIALDLEQGLLGPLEGAGKRALAAGS